MSEILTSCHLKGVGGLDEWGRLTRTEIIEKTREMARHQKADAEKILAADDNDFDCKIIRGPYVRRLVEHLLPIALETEMGPLLEVRSGYAISPWESDDRNILGEGMTK
jgi:hypothetical protein